MLEVTNSRDFEQMELKKGWWGCDLGKYRACDSTYCLFEASTMPPLDSVLLYGEFQWLIPVEPVPEYYTHVTNAWQQATQRLAEAKALDLFIPKSVRVFLQNLDLPKRFPSCT